MENLSSGVAAARPRDCPRTLVAKDGAIWIWPGIPLAMEQDGAIQPLPHDWVRYWITSFHGFETSRAPLQVALIQACRYLALGDESTAQTALDLARYDRLSPEGAALMRTVAAEFGIAPLDVPIGNKGLPWSSGNQAAQMQLLRRFGRAAEVFEKAGNPNQPRWPKDAPDSQGGRYAPSEEGAGSNGASSESPLPGIGHNSGLQEPGIGHNGGPPLDDPPDIPPEEPPTAQLRNIIIKNLAGWLLKRGVTALIPGVGEALAVIQLGVWLYKYLPYVNAYLSGPKTLDELNDDATEPKKGYDIHHIVEQTPARNEGFAEDQIESRENRVRISTLKHWEINRWYGESNPNFAGLSPREYLRGKDWAERVKVGRQALIDVGVLKP